MTNPSGRTLRLLSLLQARRYWPGALLAERLEVSPRTVRRDVDRLRELGYPVAAVRGVDGGYQLAAGAALPPLVVDDEEAVSLATALQAQVASGAIDGEPALRALVKIIQVMPKRLRRRIEALHGATTPAPWSTGIDRIDQTALIIFAQACRDQERMRFDYRPRDGPSASRHVEPFRLVPLGRRWYLVCYDLTRNDWRSFRLDRITSPAATGAIFAARTPSFSDVADYVREGVRNYRDPARQRAELIIEAPADQVTTRYARWAEVEPINATSCRVIMLADDLSWVLFLAGSMGCAFKIISPPELLPLASDWASRLSDAGADGNPGRISGNFP